MSLEPVVFAPSLHSRYQTRRRATRRDGLAGLIVASAANTTGTMLGKPELQALSDNQHALDK